MNDDALSGTAAQLQCAPLCTVILSPTTHYRVAIERFCKGKRWLSVLYYPHGLPCQSLGWTMGCVCSRLETELELFEAAEHENVQLLYKLVRDRGPNVADSVSYR